jgi:hypothetical protein
VAQQDASQIACNVKNCHYWGQKNICTADKIQVSNTDFSADMEAGSFNQPAPSEESYETQCVTFKPKQ